MENKNKILFGQRKVMNRITAAGEKEQVYLIPFTFDNMGFTHLHEPSINLFTREREFKLNLIKRIEAVLLKHNMLLLNICFQTMNLTVNIL